MTEVRVPRENTNDDEVTLVELAAAEGIMVEKDQFLAAVETTKATVEILAPAAGWIKGLADCSIGRRLAVGAVLCYIAASEDAKVPERKQLEEAKSQRMLTRKAQELMEAEGLLPALLPDSGLITEKHVRDIVATRDGVAPPVNFYTVGAAIVLFGGGARARVCIDILRVTGGFEIIGVVDDKMRPGETVLGVPVLGPSKIFEDLHAKGVRYAVNAIGQVEDLTVRSRTFDRLKAAGFLLPNVIHPKASIEPSVRMGEGNQFFAGAVVGSCATVGNNTTVNCGGIVSHDCILGNNVHIAPGGVLAGSVYLDDEVLVGMAATLYMNVSVGRGAKIRNGSHLFGNLGEKMTY